MFAVCSTTGDIYNSNIFPIKFQHVVLHFITAYSNFLRAHGDRNFQSQMNRIEYRLKDVNIEIRIY